MKVWKRILKWLLRVMLLLVALLVIISFLIQLGPVQTFLVGKLADTIASRTGTHIAVERVGIRLPSSVAISGIMIEDVQGDTLLYAGELKLHLRLTALLRNKVNVRDLSLKQLHIHVVRHETDSLFNYEYFLQSFEPEEAVPDSLKDLTRSPWLIMLNKIDLTETRLRYTDYVNGDDFSAGWGHLRSRTSMTFLTSSPFPDAFRPDFSLKDFFAELNNSEGLHVTSSIESLEIKNSIIDLAENRFMLSEVSMLEANALYQLQQEGVPKQEVPHTVFNPNDFSIKHLTLMADDIYYGGDSLQLNLNQLQGMVSDIFPIRHFSVQVSVGKALQVKDLKLESDESSLLASLELSHQIMQLDRERIWTSPLKLDLSRLLMGRDLAFFLPEINEWLSDPDVPGSIRLSGKAEGRVNELYVDNMHLLIPAMVDMQVQGMIAGLPDMDKLAFDIPSLELNMNTGKVSALLPELTLPQGVNLPDTVMLLLNATGDMASLSGEMMLETDLGNIQLSGAMSDINQPLPEYRLEIFVEELDAGYILDNPMLTGKLKAGARLAGRGLKVNTAVADYSVTLHEFSLNDYLFHQLGSEGDIREGVLHTTTSYHDEMLQFDLLASLDLKPEYPWLDASLQLDYLNTQGLHITEELLMFRGGMTAGISLGEAGMFTGQIRLEPLMARQDNQTYTLDSLIINSSLVADVYQLEIQSSITNIVYSGNISPAALPASLGQHLNAYFNMPFDIVDELHQPIYFNLDVSIEPSEWYTAVLLPDLTYMDAISLALRYDSDSSLLDMEGGVTKVIYGNTHLSDVVLLSSADPAHMILELGVKEIQMGNLLLNQLQFGADFADQELQFKIGFDDTDLTPWLRLSGSLHQNEDVYVLTMDEDVLLHRDPWHIAPGHLLEFGPGRLRADQFVLSGEGGSVSIQSTYPADAGEAEESASISEYPSSLRFDFSHFSLGQFFPSQDPAMASGIFNGMVELKDIYGQPGFVSDLQIDQLTYRGDTIGDVSLQAESTEADVYSFVSGISNYGNQVTAQGTYKTGAEPDLDANISLTHFNLSTLEGLLHEDFRDIQGVLTGELRVWGKPGSPDFSGSLRFQDASFFAFLTNVRYTLSDESISFDKSNILFRQLSITDARGQKASLMGFIDMSDFLLPRFQLNLSSNNFLAMDAPAGRNELFSGRLLIDSDLSLRGDMRNPLIEGTLKLNEGSTFVFNVPPSQPQAIGDEGVVLFFSPADTLLWHHDPAEVGQDPVMSSFQNLELSVNVEVDPKTDVRVMIDPYAGDYLEVKGGGRISFGIDPGGRMSLSGRYELTEGTYLLTFYDVLRRRFVIRRGSSMSWTGDPSNPDVDIRAVYTIRTSARELFESQMQSASATDQRYRQQFPFQVLLEMKGSLMHPDIRFEIMLPPEHQQALDGRLNARLQDLNLNESELNKQVFALLTIGNFIQDNPLASMGNGPGMSATARTSASRILSQQLNRMSDRYIQGIDIQVDVESFEEYSVEGPEGTTQLNLEVSKNFLDERLRFTVGGNVELEGERRKQTSAGDIAGDFSIEYLLNPEGSLVLKGFRQKQYRDLIDGQLIETGVSLMFTKTYNHFRELFLKKEEEVIPEDVE